MHVYRNGSEELYEKAKDLFESVPKGERSTWCKHPLTQSLVLSLYGDMTGYFEGWASGDYTGENAEATIQKNSKALGSVDAIETILVWVEDTETGDLYD